MEERRINRINKNEERFDNIRKSIDDLSKDVNNFISLKKDLLALDKYYGSKNWLKDKELHEKEKSNIKAGVLSEDGVWNTLEGLFELRKSINKLIKVIDSLNR